MHQPSNIALHYEPTWESLQQYSVPQWFMEDKLGIFIHWGVYAVPAFANEWYARNMYQQGSPEFKHHQETWGQHSKFGYKDFIPMFKAENFDADAWVDLFRRAGAKYVVPVAEHHDGFAMYDSALTRWDAKDMGPRRDLVGELAEATRSAGLTFCLSNHRMEHWDFMLPAAGLANDLYDPAYADFYGPPQHPLEKPHPGEVFAGKAAPQSAQFLEEWL